MSKLVSWGFEPSHSRRVISGLIRCLTALATTDHVGKFYLHYSGSSNGNGGGGLGGGGGDRTTIIPLPKKWNDNTEIQQ